MTPQDERSLNAAENLRFERPELADGKAVHELIRRSPPLDLNSSYCYFLLCSHYADSCVVARHHGGIVGFLSAYRLPQDAETLFIWQVAVDASQRGHGVAGKMLRQLLARPICASVRYLETTISPDNHASRRLFSSFAERHDAPWHEDVFLGHEQFGDESHDEEMLIRIGPFNLPYHTENG